MEDKLYTQSMEIFFDAYFFSCKEQALVPSHYIEGHAFLPSVSSSIFTWSLTAEIFTEVLAPIVPVVLNTH